MTDDDDKPAQPGQLPPTLAGLRALQEAWPMPRPKDDEPEAKQVRNRDFNHVRDQVESAAAELGGSEDPDGDDDNEVLAELEKAVRMLRRLPDREPAQPVADADKVALRGAADRLEACLPHWREAAAKLAQAREQVEAELSAAEEHLIRAYERPDLEKAV
jgi:hypothetical protein